MDKIAVLSAKLILKPLVSLRYRMRFFKKGENMNEFKKQVLSEMLELWMEHNSFTIALLEDGCVRISTEWDNEWCLYDDDEDDSWTEVLDVVKSSVNPFSVCEEYKDVKHMVEVEDVDDVSFETIIEVFYGNMLSSNGCPSCGHKVLYFDVDEVLLVDGKKEKIVNIVYDYCDKCKKIYNAR